MCQRLTFMELRFFSSNKPRGKGMSEMKPRTVLEGSKISRDFRKRLLANGCRDFSSNLSPSLRPLALTVGGPLNARDRSACGK